MELFVLEMLKINKIEFSFCFKMKCDSIMDICEIGNIGGFKRCVLIIKFKMWYVERFIIVFVVIVLICFRWICDFVFFFLGNKIIFFFEEN